MQSPRPVAISWGDLEPGQPVVMVPPSVAGLATAILLHGTLDNPFVTLTDPLDLVDHLAELVEVDSQPARLILAGVPLDDEDAGNAEISLSQLGITQIEWYDDHKWAPDAQAAIWPLCHRAEIGPDVPAPIHYLAHQLLDRAPFALRLIDLAENGTESVDTWVRSRYRYLAGVLQPERDNLVPDAITATAADPEDLSEVEWEIVAEQEIAEKTIERLVREELEVTISPNGTRLLVADLGEWSASPYLSLACRRFFSHQVLVRVHEVGRITVEKQPAVSIDLDVLRSLPALSEMGARVRSSRQVCEVDVELGHVDTALSALLNAI